MHTPVQTQMLAHMLTCPTVSSKQQSCESASAVSLDISAASLNSRMLQLGADHLSQLEPSLADSPIVRGLPFRDK